MENFENHEIEKKDRQLDNLINLVENHTRTKRHLEQYSHIGNPENKENARKIQDVREDQIEDLKDKIKGNDKQTREEQLENVIEKYINTAGYIHNNEDNMSEEQLNNMEKRQDNREIQIENLEEE